MADTTQTLTLAQLLRTARTQRGLSRAQLAAASRVPLNFITAIEEEDLDALPQAVFCRGFLHIIARHLQCEPTPLLTALAALHTPPTEASQLLSPHTMLSCAKRRKTAARPHRQSLSLIALLLVLSGGVVFYLLYPRPTSMPSPPPVASAPPTTALPLPPPPPPVATTAAQQQLRLQVMRPVQIEIGIDAEKRERRLLLPQSYEFAFERQAHLTITDITAVKVWFNGETLGNLVRGGRQRVLIFTATPPTTARAGEHAGHHFQR